MLSGNPYGPDTSDEHFVVADAAFVDDEALVLMAPKPKELDQKSMR